MNIFAYNRDYVQNRKLKSASNEVLESTNEELQSVNEELNTVNSKFQQRIEELITLNNDLDNILLNTRIRYLLLNNFLFFRKYF